MTNSLYWLLLNVYRLLKCTLRTGDLCFVLFTKVIQITQPYKVGHIELVMQIKSVAVE